MRKLILTGLILLGGTLLYATVKVNDAAPNFKLPAVQQATVSLSDYKGKYVVLEWTNYECPFVKKHYNSHNMQTLQSEYTKKGVVWISINSSAKGKQGNFSKDEWLKQIEEQNSNATVVALDEDGKVGKLYGAKTTPTMVVINPNGKVIYKGAIDDKATFDSEDIATAKNYVRAALDESMAGKKVTVAETESYGCSVKY